MKTSRPVENKTLAIALLQNHARNYNRHSDSQIADLRASLQQFGQVRSVVVQANGGKAYTILAGHGIIEAAKQEGYTELRADVVPASWSKTKALAYLAADNELARRGDPDQDQLAAIVQEVLDAEGEALARLAAGEQSALDALLVRANPNGEGSDAEPQTDRADALQKEWKTASGQLWQVGAHRLLIGDCTLKDNIDALLAGEEAKLLFTDPPYGINVVDPKKFRAAVGGAKVPSFGTVRAKGAYAFGGLKATRATIGARGKVDATLYRPVHGDDKPFDPCHLLVLAKHSILFGANYYASKLPDSRHWIVWDKNNTGTFADAELAWSDFETGVVMYRHTWNGMQREGARRLELKNRIHPNQKPVGLLSEILKDHSEVGDSILDVYGGSGSVMVACENTQRVCRMMEIDAAYGAVILQRMADAFGLTPKRIEQAGHGTQKIGTNTEKTGRQKGHKPQQSRQSETAVAAGRSVA